MNNESIKEICDAITPEIMKLVQNIFSDLKKEIVLEIKDEVSPNDLDEIQTLIDSKVNAYEKRIVELEDTVSRLCYKTNESNLQEYEKRIVELEETVARLSHKTNETSIKPVQRIKATAVDGISTLSAAQIEEILSFPKLSIEKDGWIYYYKLHHNNYGSVDYGEIYKVKTDGTQNQKIFNGKAHGLFIHYFELKNNMLYFHDIDNQERAIRI